jgi:hypothetical protein
MGDSRNGTVRPDLDRRIKLEFHGATVTSDAGGRFVGKTVAPVPPGG